MCPHCVMKGLEFECNVVSLTTLQHKRPVVGSGHSLTTLLTTLLENKTMWSDCNVVKIYYIAKWCGQKCNHIADHIVNFWPHCPPMWSWCPQCGQILPPVWTTSADIFPIFDNVNLMNHRTLQFNSNNLCPKNWNPHKVLQQTLNGNLKWDYQNGFDCTKAKGKEKHLLESQKENKLQTEKRNTEI